MNKDLCLLESNFAVPPAKKMKQCHLNFKPEMDKSIRRMLFFLPYYDYYIKNDYNNIIK